MSGAEADVPNPVVSVVVPVFDGKWQLELSLPALLRAAEGAAVELIVVDDGSEDGSAEYARGLGATVLPSGGRKLGPGAARNVGAAAARSEIVLFVDADVVVHPDVVSLVRGAFDRPDVVAVFGAYDDDPPYRGFASQYMNLRHHHVHQDASDEAQTFWTGLGAVRKQAFADAGGFDAERFPLPSIEDIDLGRRMREGDGRILRIPEMRGTHLKEWSLAEVVRTDVLRRALPWARLMHAYPGAFTDLNVGPAERIKAVIAGVFFASLVVGVVAPEAFVVAGASLALAAWANRGLFAVFLERNGVWFALRGLLYHQIYYVYSAAVFVWAALEHRFAAR